MVECPVCLRDVEVPPSNSKSGRSIAPCGRSAPALRTATRAYATIVLGRGAYIWNSWVPPDAREGDIIVCPFCKIAFRVIGRPGNRSAERVAEEAR